MKFEVEFKNDSYLVDPKKLLSTYSVIQNVRDLFDKTLSMDQIKVETINCCCTSEKFITLPESVIKANPIFQKQCAVSVTVPHYGLTKFVRKIYHVYCESYRKSVIKNVIVEYSIFNDSILRCWADNGYMDNLTTNQINSHARKYAPTHINMIIHEQGIFKHLPMDHSRVHALKLYYGTPQTIPV